VGGPQRQDGFTNEYKNAVSDAFKRAAMRRGVALEMWEDLVDAEFDEDTHPAGVSRTDAPPRHEAARGAGIPDPNAVIDARGVTYLKNQAREVGLDAAMLAVVADTRYAAKLESLTRAEAKDLSEHLATVGAHPKAPDSPQPTSTTGSRLVSQPQLNKLWALAGEKGVSREGVHEFIGENFSKDSTKKLSTVEASVVIDMLQDRADVHGQTPIEMVVEEVPEEPRWMRNPDYRMTP
jgi:hypothetical protein